LFVLPLLLVYTPPLIRAAFRALEARWPVRENQKPLSLRAKTISLVFVILLINLVTFLGGGVSLIQLQDNRWGQADGLAQRYPPQNTIILSSLEWDAGFRHASYYFPNHHAFGFIATDMPPNLELPEEMVLGWLYHSFQLEDNYDLNPDTYHPRLTLEFPQGATGALITGRAMLLALIYSMENGTIDPSIVTTIDDWIAYVELPDGANQLRVSNGKLIFENAGE
jgi:hypothetical protein